MYSTSLKLVFLQGGPNRTQGLTSCAAIFELNNEMDFFFHF